MKLISLSVPDDDYEAFRKAAEARGRAPISMARKRTMASRTRSEMEWGRR